jgi:glycosyltransferase involved in cell wall biosynthesis
MRILHGPVNVGNQPWVLSRAERDHGYQSDLVVAYNSWLDYPADQVLTASPNHQSAMDKAKRAAFGLKATGEYDVLHYYFGQSYIYRPGKRDAVLNFADLRLAKARGKRIFMTLQGCDVRGAAESNRIHQITMCKSDGCRFFSGCVHNQDHVRNTLVEKILPLCDRVFVLNPDLNHHAPMAEFLPYSNVNIHEIEVALPSTKKRPLVLHAPTDPLIKGSAAIEAALSVLAQEFDFDFQKVTNVPHAEAMKLYARADLVIDQILAGWYGGFAVELMAMGKPVAAYIREEDLGFVPEKLAQDLPILRIDSRNLLDDLRQIFRNRDQWAAYGAKSRTFVERWHDPMKISAALLKVYANPDAPLAI